MCIKDCDGVTTYRALIDAGHERRAIEAAVRVGDFDRLRRGVYAPRGTCAESTTAALHGGALACVSAARHLGLWVLEESGEVHVWTGSSHRYVHEDCRCIDHWDVEPATAPFALPSVARILTQILRCHGIEAFFVTLESAMRLQLISSEDLDGLRSATNAATREAVDFARSDADSGLESLLRWRLRRHGLSIRAQVQIVGVGRVDFLIGNRLIVELDGKEHHTGESARHKDLIRDANAALWGYTTLRFDYALVIHDWKLVEHTILAQLAAGRHLA